MAFQRPEGAIRGLRPDLVWSATGGSDPRSTSRLSLAEKLLFLMRQMFQLIFPTHGVVLIVKFFKIGQRHGRMGTRVLCAVSRLMRRYARL